MNKIRNIPSTALRFHLHIEDNYANYENNQDAYNRNFIYTLKCIREACVLARRLQCTVWFEDVFATYSLKMTDGYNIFVNPEDEYDHYLEWYRNTFSDKIIKYVSKEVLEDLELQKFFAGILELS